jgi:hypothetical protein
MKKKYFYLGFLILFFILLLISVGANLKLWVLNKELNQKNTPKTKIYQSGYSPDLFIDSVGQIEGDTGSFLEKKKEFIKNKEDFVAVDLKNMKISLYKEGKKFEEYDVLSKGREGSWWETPTGLYSALSKEVNHFSSIGDVWMPWSVQFYGNFFIHGWPYHPGGEPVPQSYSGGCVRLSDEDAKPVFEFIEKGMPILVYDFESKPILFSKILPEDSVLRPPKISAESAFVADLDSGEVILNKNIDSVLPVASLVKLMTATVASELIYLERGVVITDDMLKDKIQSYPLRLGEYYKAFDLLYPLLGQSSNGAGRAIASMINESYFIHQMNKKAESLNMVNTNFVDPSGVLSGNVSSLRDLSKLAKYILEKRRFIYDISKGDDYNIFGSNKFSNLNTFNEFSEDERLIGSKNGESSSALQTYVSVWSFEKNGKDRNIFIGVLGSDDRVRDVEYILDWLELNFNF